MRTWLLKKKKVMMKLILVESLSVIRRMEPFYHQFRTDLSIKRKMTQSLKLELNLRIATVMIDKTP